MQVLIRRLALFFLGTVVLLSITAPAFALSWADQLPGTSAVDVYYDFRPTILGQPNQISQWQANSAVTAMQMWSSVSNLNFIRNPWAPDNQIINIGVSSIDGQWNVLGQGGYNYTNAGGFWHIAGGIVDMDINENWDAITGNGNPGGTIDFFTVTAHEIGHALGLNHSDYGWDVMYPYYSGEKTWPSASDTANIQSLYGAGQSTTVAGGFASLEAVPEPSSLVLLGLGVAILIVFRAVASCVGFFSTAR